MRLIDADALLEKLIKTPRYFDLKFDIDNAPTIEAEPVKHGEWEITEAYPHIVYCSECHKRYAQGNWPVWNDKDMPLPRNYCPNCGAKMNKGGEDE